MTDHMRHLIVSLRVVMTMLGINLGLTYGAWATDNTYAMFIPMFCAFVCVCAWFIVELQIKRERNVNL